MTAPTRPLPRWARPGEVFDLVRLALPIAISRMSMMLMGLTDAIVLGQFSAGELPFVLNSWLPMGIMLGAGMGLLLGTQVLTSELSGRGELIDTGRIFRRGLIWAVGLGLGGGLLVYWGAGPLFHTVFVQISPNEMMSETLSPETIAAETAQVTRILSFGIAGFMLSAVAGFYLEALRRPLLVTIVSYVGVAVNLVLDLMFVAGWFGMPQLGAEGVAWATTGSRWFIAIFLLVACFALTPALKASRPGPANEARRQLGVGVGTAISNVAEWGSFNLTFVIATWISLAANAVYGYATQLLGLCFMAFLGIGTATSVRVAESFGKGDGEGVRASARLGVVATVLAGLAMGLLVIVFRGPIAGLLVNPEEAIDGVMLAPLISLLLIFVGVATVFDGLQATASMALRAQEIVWLPSLIHVGAFLFIMVPAGYVLGLVMGGGVFGMMVAVVIGVAVAGVAQTVAVEYKTARRFPDAPPALSEPERA